MSIDEKHATALRKPFPRESIGQLPKGGAMLDYVGHAAVTDRLLTVDPEWSWEPFAVTPEGLPALDRSGNLWIRLTVCGVTRIGVGDGKSAKECIGDAIRNAAMRFGVALDLWAKENLVEFAQAASAHRARPSSPAATGVEATGGEAATSPPASPSTEPKETGEAMTDKTRASMFASFSDRKINERDAQLAGIAAVIGREVESRGDLTEAEAKAVIKVLKGRA